MTLKSQKDFLLPSIVFEDSSATKTRTPILLMLLTWTLGSPREGGHALTDSRTDGKIRYSLSHMGESECWP